MRGRLIDIGLYAAAAVAAIDQGVKWWLLSFVLNKDRFVPVSPWFNLVLSWNHGVTFGFFNTNPAWHDFLPYIFSGAAFIIVIYLAMWLWRASSIKVALGLGMVIGGAIGNVIDRIRFGAVMDFLDFHYAGYHWYAFNLADSAIVGGVGLLLLDHLVTTRKKG